MIGLVALGLLFGEINAPASIEMQVGRLRRVEITCTEEATILIPPTGDKIGAFQEAGAPAGKLYFQVLPYEKGSYDLVFVSAKMVNGKAIPEYAKTVVIAGGSPIVPPKPDNPPKPDGPAREDLEGLKASLTGILGGLSEPDQSAKLKTIAGIMRQASADMTKAKTIQDVRIGLAALGAVKLKPTELSAVRQRIGGDLEERFGKSESAPIDETLRLRLTNYFTDLATLLESLA